MGLVRTAKGFCDPARDAKAWARELVRLETRCPGDTENAMRRLARRYDLSWRAFWTLRYRSPRDVAASVYLKLEAAYRAEIERQMGLLKHEAAITKLRTGPDHPAVRAAETLVGAKVDD